ncbi:MAG: histidine phosphatase family protein [Lacrimispora sp.]
MLKIYLMRHGETEWNRKKKIQGQADIPLNESGESAARGAARGMRGIPFDLVYTSPLERARKTAQIVVAGREIPIVEDDRLMEISYGKGEGQSLYLIQMLPFLRLHRYFANPCVYVPPRGGETYEQLRERCRDFLEKEICPLEGMLDHVLVTAHGALIREMICIINNIPREEFWKGIPQRNCAVTTLCCKQGKFNVMEEGKIYC